MKQLVLRTPLAQLAIQTREKFDLTYAACFRPSDVGGLANDLLAGHLITRLCLPRKTFVDVGAHIGSVISSVQMQVPSAIIVAIEAIPEKAAHLRRTFPRVQVHQLALGNSEGNVSFYVDTKQSGYSSLYVPANKDAATIIEITVPMTRLDNVVDSDHIDAIKIDVEGAELEVLRGSQGTITRNRPIIMFESGPPPNGDLGSKRTKWQFFDNNSYIVVVPNRLAHHDDGLSIEGFCESHQYPRRATNYFAVPAERQLEYRDRARQILSVT